MNVSTAAEKIQKFFGLHESDGSEDYYTENAYVEQSTSSYSSATPSEFSNEEPAENSYVNPTMQRPERKREQQVVREEPKPKPQEKPKYVADNSQENVRISKKVVQMSKTESRLQQDVAGEDTVKKISILEPRTYTEAKTIAKSVFRNEIVIVNFHLVEENQARRIVDFLTGAVYAIDGDIQRLAEEIFICTPPNTEIDSATAKSLLSTQFRDF